MNKKLLFSIILVMLLLTPTTVMADTTESCPCGIVPKHIETVTVSSDGSIITSTDVLESGVTYLLKASGTYNYRLPDSPSGWLADAIWYNRCNPSCTWVKSSLGGIHVSNGISTNNDWGDYNSGHVYNMLVDGAGNEVELFIYDDFYRDNSGSLTVDIYECVDETAPVVTIESPTDGSFVSETVNIFGSIIEENELRNYNIAIYPGDADFMNFSLRLEQKNEYLSSGFDNELIYEWDTTTYDDGKYLIRLAARDCARNRDLSGDPYIGGDDSQHVITVFVDNDNDGIAENDYCPGTIEDVPEKELRVNRWIWNGTEWITKSPEGEGPPKKFTMEDTHGCSCFQILEGMGGEMTGHYKFGCSISVIEDFIASTQLP